MTDFRAETYSTKLLDFCEYFLVDMYHDVVIDDVVTQNGSNEVYFCINSMFFFNFK